MVIDAYVFFAVRGLYRPKVESLRENCGIPSITQLPDFTRSGSCRWERRMKNYHLYMLCLFVFVIEKLGLVAIIYRKIITNTKKK
mmetsp:Transcript_29232/g.34778  ORF Transcript_29232/g.34778 Transcript_29232/m.34778 type:complete len:85 (-) Transcript_29232:1141-1395(-)